MPIPQPIPDQVEERGFSNLRYHIAGSLVPVLQIELGQVDIYFEHHILLWKDPSVQIGLKPLKGAFKRIMAGMPIFLTEARGPGHIAFSRDGVGQVFPIHLEKGQVVDVREHQFLAATGSVQYSFSRVRGVANMLFGGSGLFIDRFACVDHPGVLWLHGYGNVSIVTLGPNEQIDVEPGGWVFKDPGVSMETKLQSFSTGFFASAGQLTWNRFTGPGRVAIQSMYLHLPTDN